MVVDYQTCDSPADTMSVRTSTPASVVFNNDLQGLSRPSVPSKLSKSNVLLTLDSWIPILKHLPGLHLDQNTYYIRGSITTADWARLHDCARMVSKFIVTDKASEPKISPSVYLLLARRSETPLFLSLSDLVIMDADTSISYLELLFTPSLKSLVASCIPDAQQFTFFLFLATIEREALLLQTLILGPGRFLSSSLQIISKFSSLRHLELNYEGSELPTAFFENIGSFPMLEALVLDVRHVSTPTNQINTVDSYQPNHFPRLEKLHVVGWLALFEDLVPRIMSTKLEDISFTLVRLSYDSLAKEKGTSSATSSKKRMPISRDTTMLRFDAHTMSSIEIFRKLCCRSPASLKTVSISQLNESFQYLSNSPILPEEIFRTLLLLPAIESLEVKGWMLNSAESVFSVPESSTLKSLHLPLDETNSGISLSNMRRVAESCPKLESFQCCIKSLWEIPEYSIPTTDALSHGLRILAIGNDSPLSDTKQLYLIARHLYLLFPNLKTIKTSQKHNAEQWIVIDELIKMCQTARMDDITRPSVQQ